MYPDYEKRLQGYFSVLMFMELLCKIAQILLNTVHLDICGWNIIYLELQYNYIGIRQANWNTGSLMFFIDTNARTKKKYIMI